MAAGGSDTGEIVPIKFIKAASGVRLLGDDDDGNDTSKKNGIIERVKSKLEGYL
jgi:hypothetical protein